MQVRPIKTRVFKEAESLDTFMAAHLPRVAEGAVLVVTSKIVALAEGRTSALADEKTKERLIKSESTFALKTKWVWLTLRDRLLIANAGIDESNSAGKLILLPKDSFASASRLRTRLMKRYGVKKLGIIITDSRLMPLRSGVVGVALGYAGIRGLRDYVGKKDIFGRSFKFEKTNIVDSLATAAVLCMGEGAEQQPLAVIEGAPVEFTARVRSDELAIDLADDLYLPFFAKVPKPLLRKR